VTVQLIERIKFGPGGCDFIPTVLVPLLLVTHALVLRILIMGDSALAPEISVEESP